MTCDGARHRYRIFLSTLLVCLLKYTGGLPMQPEAFDFRVCERCACVHGHHGQSFIACMQPLLSVFQKVRQALCQLDHEGELNVPISSKFRTFTRNIFGAPMSDKIARYVSTCEDIFARGFVLSLVFNFNRQQKQLIKEAAKNEELRTQRKLLRKQLDNDLEVRVSARDCAIDGCVAVHMCVPAFRKAQIKRAKHRDRKRRLVVEKKALTSKVAFGRCVLH